MKHTVIERLRFALQTFREANLRPEPEAFPIDDDPPFEVPAGQVAKPLYEHWHPRGRNLYGWLLLDKRSAKVRGFVPHPDLFGITVDALSLRDALGTPEIKVQTPVSIVID